jgi:hypothetical protein
MARRVRFPFVLAVVAIAAGGFSLRAEEVDRLLYRQARKLYDTIAAKKAGTVAVLKFRAQKASEPETFHAGRINMAMAEMLENVLIAGKVNLDQDTRIVRNASLTASQAGQRLNYLNPADRAKLFNLVYAEAEGGSATPDVFFTGVVRLDQRSHTTTVVIEAFDRQANTIEEIASFTADSDQNTINDFGQAYVLATRDVLGRPDRDVQRAADAWSDRMDSRPLPTLPESLAVLKMFLNKQPVPFDPDPAGPSPGALRFTCREPQENDTVEFEVQNLSKDQRVAVVLKINGESTLKRERDAALYCQKWIVEPGRSISIGGFYEGESGKNMRKFVVKPTPDPEEPLSPTLQGTIDFHVFVEDRSGPARPDGAIAHITRGLPSGPASYLDLNRAVFKPAGQLQKRGLILPGAADQGYKLEPQEFLNPREQAHWFIRYMAPKN